MHLKTVHETRPLNTLIYSLRQDGVGIMQAAIRLFAPVDFSQPIAYSMILSGVHATDAPFEEYSTISSVVTQAGFLGLLSLPLEAVLLVTDQHPDLPDKTGPIVFMHDDVNGYPNERIMLCRNNGRRIVGIYTIALADELPKRCNFLYLDSYQ